MRRLWQWPSVVLFCCAISFTVLYRTLIAGISQPSLVADDKFTIEPFGTAAQRCMLPDGSFTTLRAGLQSHQAPALGALSHLDPNLCGPLPPNVAFPTSGHEFEVDNGTKWTIEYVGNISFTGELGKLNLVGDKCRSSKLGTKVIWNCGDMWCNFDYTICGFAMGPALYGTDSVMVINTTGIFRIYDNDFVRPWEGDLEPQPPSKFWGMDTSNVAEINETHGVAYGNQVWRGSGEDVRQGTAVASVTLGENMPIATRRGPLLTGPDVVEMGMLAILRAGKFIYIYSVGGPAGLVVTRVPAGDEVFDVSKYESLEFGTKNTWSSEIPAPNTTKYGMSTATLSTRFGCMVYGSAFYSNYLNKYVIICNIYMIATNMFTSDTPYGPWSDEYGLLREWNGYGSMAHPMYSPNGYHKEFYFSQGPNDGFNMFKVSFKYDESLTQQGLQLVADDNLPTSAKVAQPKALQL